MKLLDNVFLKTLLLASITLLTACSEKIANYDSLYAHAKRTAALADESPAKSLQQAAMTLEQAKKQKLTFFAPRHLMFGTEELVKAKEMHTSGEPDGVVKTQAKLAQKMLERGLDVRKHIRKDLDPTLKHRDQLVRIRSNKLFPDDFRKVSEDISKLIDLMEDGMDVQARSNQKPLLRDMRALEVKTIEFTQLQAVKDLLQRVKNRNGDDVASITYAQAQKALEKAQAVIQKDPRDKAAIDVATRKASHASQRADVITDMANSILDSNDESAEIIALRVEGWLHKTSNALQIEDARNEPFMKQNARILDKILEK